MRGTRQAELRPTGWDESLGLVAERLTQAAREHGPDSVAILTWAKCSNEANYLAQKLAWGVIGTNNVDHCARL